LAWVWLPPKRLDILGDLYEQGDCAKKKKERDEQARQWIDKRPAQSNQQH
jgi:hypothetical protein